MSEEKVPDQRQNYVKYYILGDIMPFSEDETHEFKGHKNVSTDELPRWSQATKWDKSSRKAVSRNLCGFLNTGLGGTVYCGVLDDGSVVGLKLTQYQRDHVVGSVHDLMARYKPRVAPHQYTVRFVPVLSPSTTPDEREKLAAVNPRDLVDDTERKRKHAYRTPQYCWCDFDCKARYHIGITPTSYVIEMCIKPWDCDDPRNKGIGEYFNVHPIYTNEEGCVSFRRTARIIQYPIQEVAELIKSDVRDRSEHVIARLQKQITDLKMTIASKQTSDSGI